MITAIALSTMLSVGAASDTNANVITTDVAAPSVMLIAEEEMGFVEKWIPFMPGPLTDQTPLEPEVQENFWVLALVSGILPWGSFWAPMVFLDGVELHEDHTMESLIGWTLHIPGYWFFYIPGIYLNMVHGIHVIDRNIKKARGKPRAQWSMNDVEALPGMEVAAAAY